MDLILTLQSDCQKMIGMQARDVIHAIAQIIRVCVWINGVEGTRDSSLTQCLNQISEFFDQVQLRFANHLSSTETFGTDAACPLSALYATQPWGL